MAKIIDSSGDEIGIEVVEIVVNFKCGRNDTPIIAQKV